MTEPDALEPAIEVVEVLEELGIPYFLGGSLASSLHGIPRSTQDAGVSDRQWGDVQGVLKIQRGRLDLDYLRYAATELGVGDLLEQALAEAGVA